MSEIPAATSAAEATRERALLRLRDFGSELRNGFTSHAPMVVDALVELGHPECIDPWLDGYLADALPRQPAAEPVAVARWQAFLGRAESEAAWLARFQADIDSAGWQRVLAEWCVRLAPGFAASAAHGVIRTAHAVRALERADTALRREELAAGLALWASSWQRLPGVFGPGSARLGAIEALAGIPLVPLASRRNEGAITTALGVLEDQPDFVPASGAFDRDRPVDVLALDLATAFAQLFLDQVRTPLYAIVFTHAITGVAAAGRLAPWAGEEGARALLAHAWQTGAALHACYSVPEPVESRRPEPVPGHPAQAAAQHGDEHVIKLAEACLAFQRVGGDPRFPAVIARALAVLPPA